MNSGCPYVYVEPNSEFDEWKGFHASTAFYLVNRGAITAESFPSPFSRRKLAIESSKASPERKIKSRIVCISRHKVFFGSYFRFISFSNPQTPKMQMNTLSRDLSRLYSSHLCSKEKRKFFILCRFWNYM